MTLPSTKPYLIRAIVDWCADHGFTPHIAVQVDAATQVPRDYVRDGQIVLNISSQATHNLLLGDREIRFEARFGGKPYPVVVPVGAVIAVFARENGQGLAFAAETSAEEETGGSSREETERTVEEPAPRPPAQRGSHLRRIK